MYQQRRPGTQCASTEWGDRPVEGNVGGEYTVAAWHVMVTGTSIMNETVSFHNIATKVFFIIIKKTFLLFRVSDLSIFEYGYWYIRHVSKIKSGVYKKSGFYS